MRQLRCVESASRRRRRRRRCIHNASAMSDASAPNDREALQQMRTMYSVAMTPVHFLPTARAAQLRVFVQSIPFNKSSHHTGSWGACKT